jgi:hypothetical protein
MTGQPTCRLTHLDPRARQGSSKRARRSGGGTAHDGTTRKGTREQGAAAACGTTATTTGTELQRAAPQARHAPAQLDVAARTPCTPRIRTL